MKQRPPADLQPALWPMLALANHMADEPASLPDKQPQNEPDQPCLADKPVSLPEQQPDAPLAARDQAAAALAYLAKLGRPPAAAVQLTAAARRYLNGPLVVGSRSQSDTTPGWLRDAIQVARLGLVLAGETELASEEEAVAYLMAASLEAPLMHTWAELYFWLCAHVLTRWGQIQEDDFWAVLGEDQPWRDDLGVNRRDNLRRLLADIRRSVEKHAGK